MYLLGHVGLALVVGAAFVVAVGAGRRTGVGVGSLVLLASAPDADLLVAGLPHRGITHTVWAAVALGSALAAGGWLVARRRGGRCTDDALFAFGVGTACGLTHLVGDAITPMGISPLSPLVGTSYSMGLVSASDPTANLAFLLWGLWALVAALTLERLRWGPALRAAIRARRPARAPDLHAAPEERAAE